MSFFSWFRRPAASAKSQPTAEPSRSWQGDATVPLLPGHKGLPPVPPRAQDRTAQRKSGRMEQRELLYAVVRESMVSTGVLSSNYKFKVLSLDPQGHQFLVMMDLAREYGGQTLRWNEAEVLIAQTAKMRHGILVAAVYWRINDHVAVGIRQGGAAPHGTPLAAQPPLHAAVRPPMGAAAAAPERALYAAPVGAAAAPVGSMAAPAAPIVAAAPVAAPVAASHPSALSPLPQASQRAAPHHEPIEADEVAAFKRALSQAAASSAAPAAAIKPGVAVRSGPLLPPASLTGFEDTEMPEGQTSPPDLGSTQYGELN